MTYIEGACAVALIGRTQASRGGDEEFGSAPSQTNDFYNVYLLLPNLTLSINRIEQGLVR